MTLVAWAVTVLVLVALILGMLAIAVAYSTSYRAKSIREALRRRFGPEYDRALERFSSPEKAERTLLARARRVRKFHIRELTQTERQQYLAAWRRLQTRFVDDPSGAIYIADGLIQSAMQTRGYPVEDFEQRVNDLSVDHANVVQHYRAAQSLARGNGDGQVDTESLRQAVIHYRSLFSELIETKDTSPVNLQEAHA